MPSPNRDTQRTVTCTATSRNNITGVSGVVTEGTSLTSRDYLVTVSSRTPGFRGKSKHQLPINYYHKRTIKLEDRLTYRIEYRGPGVNRTGTWVQTCSFAGWVDLTLGPAAEDPTPRLTNALLEGINQSKTNVLVGMAEFNKTADLVTSTATRLYKSIKALRRGDFPTFLDEIGVRWHPKAQRRFSRGWARANHPNNTREKRRANTKQFVAQTWLEYQYGWKPLLSDVYSHAEAFAEQATEKADIIRTCSRKGNTKRESIKSRIAGSAFTEVRTSTSEVWVKLGVRYKIPNGGVPLFHSFGVSNPLEVAWEIVPFSFVADWFLPVGDYLRAFSSSIGLEFKDGYRTVKTKTTLVVSLTNAGIVIGAGTPTTQTPYVDDQKYTFELFDIERVPMQTFPLPSLPEWKDPRSLAHGASAIALLTSLFLH